MADTRTDTTAPVDDFSATGFCPVCNSTVDIIGTGEHVLECSRCGQTWLMSVIRERFERFSAL